MRPDLVLVPRGSGPDQDVEGSSDILNHNLSWPLLHGVDSTNFDIGPYI